MPGALGDNPDPNHVAINKAGDRKTSRLRGEATAMVSLEEMVVSSLLALGTRTNDPLSRLHKANLRRAQR